MLVSDISRKVKRLFGEGSSIFISDADIIDWVNNGILEIVRETKCNSTIGSVAATAFPYSIPGLIQVQRVLYGSQPLPFVDLDDLDSKYVDLTVKSTPVYYYVAGESVDIYPRASIGDITQVFINYTKTPLTITLISETPSIPTAFHEDLVVFCKMRAYERNQDWRAQEKAQDEFNSKIATRLSQIDQPEDGYAVIRDDPWEW